MKAEELLFGRLYGQKPLFNTQQELVNQLLDNEESGYYVPKDSQEYSNRLNRLKSYISQLLSDNISRTVTPVFRQSIGKVIERRLNNTEFNPIEITNSIVSYLTEKNKSSNRKIFISSFNPKKDLIESIVKAHYVLVVTARAFDISDDESRFSFQQFLIQDLLSSISNPEKSIKYFRFNFPLKSLCDLFWLALYKNLEKTLAQKMASLEFVESLYLKSLINISLYNSIKSKTEITNEDISFVTNELLNYLNKNKFVHVFLVEAPIFSVPMIVTNPNESKNSNAYVVLENESKSTHISKLPAEDILTWKFFVYDKIKTQNSGQQVDYKYFSTHHF